MTKKLPLRWTVHLKTPEAKKQFEVSLRASSTALHRLLEILEEDAEGMTNKSLSAADFEEPNWAYKQAYRNGALASIKHIQELLSFLDRR